jgi:hypothetical protein
VARSRSLHLQRQNSGVVPARMIPHRIYIGRRLFLQTEISHAASCARGREGGRGTGRDQPQDRAGTVASVGTPATRTASCRSPTRYSTRPRRNRKRRPAGQRAEMIQPSRVSRTIVMLVIVRAGSGSVDTSNGL